MKRAKAFLIFILPANLRAFFLCAKHGFGEDVSRYDTRLSIACFDWADGKETTEFERAEWKLKQRLCIPSLWLIRRNSDIEKQFIFIENEHYSEESYRQK